MDENTIAQKQLENIPHEEHVEAPTDTRPQEPELSAFESNMMLKDPAISLAVADYFEIGSIDRHNEIVQRQMRTVYEFAAELAQSNSLENVLPLIRQIELEIGAQLKPDKLARLAKFCQLKRQSLMVQAQLGSFYV